MRRFHSFVFVALLAPTLAFAQAAAGAVGSAATNDTPAAAAGKAKPKSAFGAVIAELTRAAKEQASAQPKAGAPNDAATALPPPPKTGRQAALADSSGG